MAIPRGQKPKPAAIKAAEGDTRKIGSRKLAAAIAAEPQPERGLPECPQHLDGRAKDAWVFWAQELQSMGLDCRCDAQMLEGACVNYGRAVQADQMLKEEGIIFEESVLNDQGEKVILKLKAHPAVNISNVAWRQVRAFCGEFGLSPVSRARISVPPKEDQSADLMKILSQPRPAKDDNIVQ